MISSIGRIVNVSKFQHNKDYLFRKFGNDSKSKIYIATGCDGPEATCQRPTSATFFPWRTKKGVGTKTQKELSIVVCHGRSPTRTVFPADSPSHPVVVTPPARTDVDPTKLFKKADGYA